MNHSLCYHCQDVVPNSRIQASAEKQFCCGGCEIAYQIIGDNNAAAFYDMRQLSGISQSKHLSVGAENFGQAYSSDSFTQHYVQQLKPQQHAVTWYVQGAHCAACVWLLERLHTFDPGIQSTRLNIGSQQLITYYDPAQTNPAQIAQCLAKIGYLLYPWHSPIRKRQQLKTQRNLLLRFAVSCASMVATMHVSWNLLAGEFSLDLDPASRQMFALMAALFSLPALTYCAWPWYKSAWQGIKQKTYLIDHSIASIILLGGIISFWHLALGRSDLYFDAMAMFVCFLLAGKLMLYMAQQQVGQQQDTLKQLLPLFARRALGEKTEEICLDDIAVGDELIIASGERLPVDGILLSDHILIDNALLSGEQYPIEHQKNAQLYAGALVLDQACRLQATSAYHNSRVAEIMQQEIPRKQHRDLSDTLLYWFTPIVSLIGLFTWLAWSFTDTNRAWDQAIAVFIVACPCALGIAAPLSHAVATRVASRLGILIHNPHSLGKIHQAQHIVFDKTGTITTGQLQVLDSQWFTENPQNIIPHLLIACRQSHHPIARCLCDYFGKQASISNSRDSDEITKVEFHTQGLSYQCASGELRLQKAAHAESKGSNHTELLLNHKCIARFSFTDQCRNELLPFLTQQHKFAQLHICSGDHQASVERTSRALQFSSAQCIGDQSPEQKQHYIQSLQQNKQATVIMIGDGVNDALALQSADIGIGVRGGLEAAMQHSDIYISEHIEERLPQLWQIATEHRRCLHSCLYLSLAYNIIGITCAALGYWGPFICAVAMPLSSLSVMAMAWYWPFVKSETACISTTHTQIAYS